MGMAALPHVSSDIDLSVKQQRCISILIDPQWKDQAWLWWTPIYYYRAVRSQQVPTVATRERRQRQHLTTGRKPLCLDTDRLQVLECLGMWEDWEERWDNVSVTPTLYVLYYTFEKWGKEVSGARYWSHKVNSLNSILNGKFPFSGCDLVA